MTMSGRQESSVLPPGKALAQPSAEQWGVTGRIQTALNSGYWKRLSAELLTASASNLSKEASGTAWTSAVQKSKAVDIFQVTGP